MPYHVRNWDDADAPLAHRCATKATRSSSGFPKPGQETPGETKLRGPRVSSPPGWHLPTIHHGQASPTRQHSAHRQISLGRAALKAEDMLFHRFCGSISGFVQVLDPTPSSGRGETQLESSVRFYSPRSSGPSRLQGAAVGQGEAPIAGHCEQRTKGVGYRNDFSQNSLTYFATQLRIAYVFAF